ncbi:MAG: hypothetical protein IRY85_01510 [Micromonosporaceae bacterium]|nr:hypothetical protein [Micromonosporaceae bacterium]
MRFARFAYPPNALGYCGPDDSVALLGHADAGVAGPDLVHLARQFAGAWPYLELIAAASGRPDPLDGDVVEAYWLGNDLLTRVDGRVFAAHLTARFEARAGAGMADIATLALLGAVPHHNFHVMAVYPWVGLLRAGVAAEEPMRVLDSCRIRWGRVVAIDAGLAEVAVRPLVWDGRSLHLGAPRVEAVTCADVRGRLVPDVRVGDVVALHWDWLCDVLSARQARALRGYTERILRMTNEALARPVAAAILG